MTGPELFELGSSIVKNITEGETHACDVQAQAALAAACFAGAQAAAFGAMAAEELDGEDDAMSKAWATAIGLEIKDTEDGA